MPKCDGFRCNLGACIPWQKVCDGKPDCREREDESVTSCVTKTNSYQQDRKYYGKNSFYAD